MGLPLIARKNLILANESSDAHHTPQVSLRRLESGPERQAVVKQKQTPPQQDLLDSVWWQTNWFKSSLVVIGSGCCFHFSLSRIFWKCHHKHAVLSVFVHLWCRQEEVFRHFRTFASEWSIVITWVKSPLKWIPEETSVDSVLSLSLDHQKNFTQQECVLRWKFSEWIRPLILLCEERGTTNSSTRSPCMILVLFCECASNTHTFSQECILYSNKNDIELSVDMLWKVTGSQCCLLRPADMQPRTTQEGVITLRCSVAGSFLFVDNFRGTVHKWKTLPYHSHWRQMFESQHWGMHSPHCCGWAQLQPTSVLEPESHSAQTQTHHLYWHRVLQSRHRTRHVQTSHWLQ